MNYIWQFFVISCQLSVIIILLVVLLLKGR